MAASSRSLTYPASLRIGLQNQRPQFEEGVLQTIDLLPVTGVLPEEEHEESPYGPYAPYDGLGPGLGASLGGGGGVRGSRRRYSAVA